MSELQIGLIAIGVAIVAAVFAYNKWQESRYRREAEASIAPPGEDVLLREGATSGGRMEPVLQPDEPVLEDVVPLQPPPAQTAAAAVLHEAIDFIAILEATQPVSGRAFLAAASTRLRGLPKSVHMEGAAEDSGEGWSPLRQDASYSMIRVGMQLVDRKGSASAQELQRFLSAVEQAATAAGLNVSPADMPAALQTAAELDRLCSEVDIQIAVHVVAAADAFRASQISELAAAAGLILDRDGRFRLRDEQGREVFALANEEAARFSPHSLASMSTSTLLLELDVPRAPGGPDAFARFRDFSLQAAQALGGALVDDNRSVLGRPSFDAIAAQLQPVYESMESRGVAAGGPLALRLFS